MANISVLEGRIEKYNATIKVMRPGKSALKPNLSRFHASKGSMPAHKVTGHPHPWRRRSPALLGACGNIYGGTMGRSIWGKIKNVAKSTAKVAVSPVTMTYSVTKATGKAVVKAVKKPSISNFAAIVTKPIVRAGNETKTVAKEAVHATAESLRATKMAADVGYRVVKRLVRKLAAKVLLKGDFLSGEGVAKYPKNAAKGVLIPLATAAVVANTTTAPFSPAVPVIVNTVIDELYAAVEKKIKKGLSPEQAKKEISDALNSDDDAAADAALGVSNMTPWIIGGVGALLLILVLKRRR